MCVRTQVYLRRYREEQKVCESKSSERVHINVAMKFWKGEMGTMQFAANTPLPSIFYTINMALSHALAPAGDPIPSVNGLIFKGN